MALYAGRCAATALLPALVCGAAWAQAADADDHGPWIAVGLAAALAAAAAGWLGWRLNRERSRADRHRSDAARSEAFLNALPHAYCGWSDAGVMAVSERFQDILGLGRVDGLEDVENALGASDAAALHGAFSRLRQSGEGFELAAGTADGRRRLKITGRRGRAFDAGDRFDVLWLEDVTEVEAALRHARDEASEARRVQAELCAVLDALPLPVWLRRPDLSLGWVNRAYRDAVDGTLDAVIEEQREITAGGIGESGRALAQRAQRDGACQSESRHVVVGGERRLMELSETPMALPAEDGAGPTIGYAFDVTRLEEARSELARYVAAHAEVLEKLKSAIAIFGPDKRLAFFNQAYVSLWGFDEAWLESEPSLSELLEDMRERRRLPEYADFPAYKRSQNELFTSLLESDEDLMHLPDGATLRSVVTPHPFGGLLFVQEDVTSALTLERSYNTLMAVQRESLDNLAEGIVVYGSDGRLRLSNPAFLRLWNLSPEDLAGTPHVTEVIEKTRGFYTLAGSWEERRGELVAAALERSETVERLERSDGSVLMAATVPLPDGGVLNSFLDITDSARIEQALRASNAALETADRLKSEFIANVSYQLRTPLNAIMGFAEILNNKYFGELNSRQVEYTESIIDASQRLLSLINDILDLATIEAGYMALERKPVDIQLLLRSVYDLTREWAGKQSLKVTIKSDPSIGIVEADERRLKQALYNLVSNAIKFTPPGGEITLSAERDAEQVSLIVSDTGIGIPEADQQRVFGRFEKVHPNSRHSGVGLGLALVRSFIEMHGGRLVLTSKPGEGTTFSCILPVSATPSVGLPVVLDAAQSNSGD
ncbi:MAG TPA: ATP-binding protein [Alphaproteobacteria bacterium]|nr:ATP-binding protein [Alphaproteobacteria bacterium]